jgi:hypothetical protein
MPSTDTSVFLVEQFAAVLLETDGRCCRFTGGRRFRAYPRGSEQCHLRVDVLVEG